MTDDISERLRRAFDADSVAEKNLAIRAAFDFIAAMQPAPQEPVDSAAEITRLTEALRAAEEREKGLREALEPFAKCCEDWISDDEDDEEWAKFRLLIKDYRRASVAMKEQGHDG